MKKTRTTPLHPQSDGMVERFNRTIETQLSMFVDNHHQDWDQHVPLLLMAYRSAVHDTTNCTPARLVLVRDLRLPVDLLYTRPEEENLSTPYAEDLQEKLERVHAFARKHLKMSSDRMKSTMMWALQQQSLREVTPYGCTTHNEKKACLPSYKDHGKVHIWYSSESTM